MNEYPKLRFVEAIPLDHEGDRRYALRDPSGMAEDMIVVSGEALFILQYFDGKHSRQEIRAEFQQALGAALPERKLQDLITALEQAHFLESESFQDYKRRLENQMLAQPLRPAAHAGASYPAEAEPLRQRLEALYQAGAGWPVLNTPVNGAAVVQGLIAPHIDLRVGGACYTYAYHALAMSTPADIYVILGTGHSGLVNCYSCLQQDFATPLGTVKHNADNAAQANELASDTTRSLSRRWRAGTPTTFFPSRCRTAPSTPSNFKLFFCNICWAGGKILPSCRRYALTPIPCSPMPASPANIKS